LTRHCSGRSLGLQAQFIEDGGRQGLTKPRDWERRRTHTWRRRDDRGVCVAKRVAGKDAFFVRGPAQGVGLLPLTLSDAGMLVLQVGR